ncbi:MAG: hypothetical protein ACRD33_04690 [Candidatus Acidiferrales bacterium]
MRIFRWLIRWPVTGDVALKTPLKLLLLCGLIAIPPGIVRAQLPPSKNAPKVGEKAPDFTLPDSTGKAVRLYDLLSSRQVASGATSQKDGSWVLLIFYRGYW